MRLNFMDHTAGNANLKGPIQFDGAWGRGLLAVLCAGALSLAVSTVIGFQFPASICDAQTANCAGNFIPPDESPQYFPTGVFDLDGTGTGVASYTSCLLRAMEERPMIPATVAAGRGAYRLTLMPSWGGPFVVRLQVQTDGTAMLVRKEARSISEAGTLIVNGSQEVSKDKVDKFDSLLNKSVFWSMAPLPMRFARGRWWSLLDMGGVRVVLEAASPGAYHVVTRSLHYGPAPPTDPFDLLTLYLFKDLAHFEVPPIPPLPSKHKH